MINKSSLLTQINSSISSLNLSTEETEKLVLSLKTALNTNASNSTLLISELTTRAESSSIAEELKELMLLVTATKLITNDRMLNIIDLTTLTALSNISAGSIYFVDSEQVPYIKKSDGTWVLIDPSLQPVPVENAYAWGSGSNGRLGDNSIVNKSSPVSVVGGFTDWVQVYGGGDHSLGLRANGTAWAWGSGANGRLGDNTSVSKSSPVSVVGGFTDWVQVSGGDAHSLGLRANGVAYAWGSNGGGQLGDGSYSQKSSPVSVAGGFTDWVQISAGGAHSLGVRANGLAYAWGYNSNGQLGNNTTVTYITPELVVGGFTDWVQVSGNSSSVHSLGLRANGLAYAWGLGTYGRLGNNSTLNRSSPVLVAGGFTDWVQVSAGGNHNLGVRANGLAYAWGRGAQGRLGDGTTVDKSSPVLVVGGFTDWVQVSGGGGNVTGSHSIGLRANGSVWAWGLNSSGQLGDGTTVSKLSPVSVVGGFADWVQVSGGSVHSLGLRGSN